MPLESGTFISDLVDTNPLGTDQKSQGDDHLRLIKSVILNTFPNITGEVTGSHTDFNALSAELGNYALLNQENIFTERQIIQHSSDIEGLGLRRDNAAVGEQSWIWRVTAAGSAALQTSQDDFSANIESAIVATRSAGAVTSVDILGDSITLNGVDSSDFARLSQSNTFTGFQQRINSSGNPHYEVTDGTIIAKFQVVDNDQVLIGAQTSHDISFITGNAFRATIDSAGVFTYGGLEVGYRGGNEIIDDGNRTLITSDRGRSIRYNGTGGHAYTVNSMAGVRGDVITIVNISGSPLTIAEGTATLRLSGVGSTGNVTLSGDFGIATLYAYSTSGGDIVAWIVSGNGVS